MSQAKVSVGSKVPDFAGESTAGDWRLRDARGTPLVIYFYPRDMTSGCTQEGEDFAALYGAFRKVRTAVLGVSPDSLASHEKFRAKYKFPFALLSDPQQSVCKLFDVYKQKRMYGRQYMGVERSTFLLDGEGVLRQEWRKVKVTGHAAEVLAAAKAL